MGGPAAQVRAQNGSLNVAAVIFALALLRLPQLYMCTFFVRGVETVSELRISLRRLNAFLSLPEPPPPAHSAPGAADLPARALGISPSTLAPK